MNAGGSRITVSISKTTKTRMDKWRAPGQCYDCFVCEMVSLWERMHNFDSKREVKSARHKH